MLIMSYKLHYILETYIFSFCCSFHISNFKCYQVKIMLKGFSALAVAVSRSNEMTKTIMCSALCCTIMTILHNFFFTIKNLASVFTIPILSLPSNTQNKEIFKNLKPAFLKLQ